MSARTLRTVTAPLTAAVACAVIFTAVIRAGSRSQRASEASTPAGQQPPAVPGGGRGRGRGPAGPPPPARQGAPVDLTGNWVSVVTEDWQWRMRTPPKGDYASVPMTPARAAAGRHLGSIEGWDVRGLWRGRHHAHAGSPAYQLAGRQHAEDRNRRRTADASASLHAAGRSSRRRCRRLHRSRERCRATRSLSGSAVVARSTRSLSVAPALRRRAGDRLKCRDDQHAGWLAAPKRCALQPGRGHYRELHAIHAIPTPATGSSSRRRSRIRRTWRSPSSRARISRRKPTGRSGIRSPVRVSSSEALKVTLQGSGFKVRVRVLGSQFKVQGMRFTLCALRIYGVLGLVIVCVGSSIQSAQSLVGRTAAAARSEYSPPRTPWGDPDLQGDLHQRR